MRLSWKQLQTSLSGFAFRGLSHGLSCLGGDSIPPEQRRGRLLLYTPLSPLYAAMRSEEDSSFTGGTEMDFNQDLKKGGVKKDLGKERVDLLPPNALLALAELMDMGAKKYDDRNWEKGMDEGRIMAALGRHFLKYMAGEDFDPDPVAGHHHLIHIAWNALVAYELQVTGKAKDTRTKLRKKPLGEVYIVDEATDFSIADWERMLGHPQDQNSREKDAGLTMREAIRKQGNYVLKNFPDHIKMKCRRWNFLPGDIIMAKLHWTQCEPAPFVSGADTLYGYVPAEEFSVWEEDE